MGFVSEKTTTLYVGVKYQNNKKDHENQV